jgi:hypothetical protein
MMQINFQDRILENKDWATALFVFSFALIAVAKTTFENRFSDFLRLLISDKYIKIYKDSSNLMSWFTIILFVVHLLSLAFFIQLLLSYFGFAAKTDWLFYIRVSTLLGVFILSKYLVEKIISVTFNIEEFTEQFNLKKVSYRTYIGILLLPMNFMLFYNNNVSINIIYTVLIAILLINIVTYLNSLKLYQSLIFGKLFYFILYLCALEIAPYYFMYYWFTTS